jgi:hypothetical protein
MHRLIPVRNLVVLDIIEAFGNDSLIYLSYSILSFVSEIH